jgi:hypothetical protein
MPRASMILEFCGSASIAEVNAAIALSSSRFCENLSAPGERDGEVLARRLRRDPPLAGKRPLSPPANPSGRRYNHAVVSTCL